MTKGYLIFVHEFFVYQAGNSSSKGERQAHSSGCNEQAIFRVPFDNIHVDLQSNQKEKEYQANIGC